MVVCDDKDVLVCQFQDVVVVMVQVYVSGDCCVYGYVDIVYYVVFFLCCGNGLMCDVYCLVEVWLVMLCMLLIVFFDEWCEFGLVQYCDMVEVLLFGDIVGFEVMLKVYVDWIGCLMVVL